VVQRKAGEIREERGHQHDALDPDVHHARTFVEHAAERAEREGRREEKDDRQEIREDQKEVDAELPDQTKDGANGVHQVGSGGGAPPAHVCVTVASSGMIGFAPRTRKTRRTMRSAARNRMTSAWMMSMISIGTLVSICMSGAPARNAPKRIAANRIPIGLDRPRRASAIESKTTDAVMPGAQKPSTPSTSR